ncbi:hypothetical protein LSTR_LSTR014461 [Laodelphax striatellus]|uniref:Peptidase S1 domain-containing protein n=1 Tax=Laodelphax striatellus TaxID=195883 RepID=A0A482XE08_LAOST|nr:hypothetical protein LSTR_LSTR014461 [Laodelphax striatellus]
MEEENGDEGGEDKEEEEEKGGEEEEEENGDAVGDEGEKNRKKGGGEEEEEEKKKEEEEEENGDAVGDEGEKNRKKGGGEEEEKKEEKEKEEEEEEKEEEVMRRGLVPQHKHRIVPSEFHPRLSTQIELAEDGVLRQGEVSKAPEDSLMLDLLVFEECEKAFDKNYLPTGFHKEGMICAGQKSLNKSKVCLNELGGPVTLPPNEKLLESECFLIRVAGVWTRAFKCSKSASVGVFTNVAYFIPWIESIVWPKNATSSLQVWQ